MKIILIGLALLTSYFSYASQINKKIKSSSLINLYPGKQLISINSESTHRVKIKTDGDYTFQCVSFEDELCDIELYKYVNGQYIQVESSTFYRGQGPIIYTHLKISEQYALRTLLDRDNGKVKILILRKSE